jgi:O-antigen/teichoic acid export membrane protein
MFLTNILLARALPQGDYGVYSILLAMLFLLNGIHSSVVSYPLSVEGAAAAPEALRRQTGAALLLTALLAAPAGILLWLGAGMAGRSSLAVWALAAGLVWQVQETFRRALMAHLRHRHALAGDATSYAGQALLIWFLSRSGLLTLEAAFAAMAFTSSAGGFIQLLQAGVRAPSIRELAQFGRISWRLGGWVLLANMVNLFSLRVFVWVTAIFHGAAVSASLQAANNVAGICHPVMFSLTNLLVPGTVREHQSRGAAAAFRWAWKQGLLAGGLLLPALAVLWIWPEAILRLAYGDGSPYLDLAGPVRALGLAYCFAYFAHVASVLLNGLKKAKAAFALELSGGLAGLAAGVPLTAANGLAGACQGIIAVNFVRALAGVALANRERKQGTPPAAAPLEALPAGLHSEGAP